MIWDDLLGHDEQTTMFRRSIQRGRLCHGYLFAGPQGVGKQLFARRLAQCLLCERFGDDELDACGECPGCRQLLAGSHPDFIAIGCPEGKKELPIELLVGPRERRGKEGLCYELSLRPMAGGRKVALIDDAHTMNTASANSLLKTLEEPPPGSLVILIAPSVDDMLPTIRSRCQLVRFAPLSAEHIAQLLLQLEWVTDQAEADTIASLSDGSLDIACQLLDPSLRGLRNQLYDGLTKSDAMKPQQLAKSIVDGLDVLEGGAPEQRRNAGWLIRFSIEFYRQALRVVSTGQPSSITQVNQFVSQLTLGPPDDAELIMRLFERTTESVGQLDQFVSVPLCFEGLFDELGRLCRAEFETAGAR